MLFLVWFFRILWQAFPSLWACILFWVVISGIEIQYIRKPLQKINWWTKTPILLGMCMNALVTLANNGRMPFFGHIKAKSLWVLGTGKHLLFFCDRFETRWAIFSIGDFFIIGGLLLSLLIWFFREQDESIESMQASKKAEQTLLPQETTKRTPGAYETSARITPHSSLKTP